jgi:hypothetical protein
MSCDLEKAKIKIVRGALKDVTIYYYMRNNCCDTYVEEYLDKIMEVLK